MLNAVDELPVVEFSKTWFLLIPSRFPPVPLYKRIAGGRDDEVSALADTHNPRVKEMQLLTGGVTASVDVASPRLQNWNLAPFTYPNPEGSWFFDQFTRCLEMSGDKQTALAVSVAKRELFLDRTGEPPVGLDMRMLSREVSGRFLDARGFPGDLHQDARRSLGRSILKMRESVYFDGVLFKSLERPIGERIAVLTGEVLRKAIQGEHFRYTWDGSRIVSLYEFNSTRTVEENEIDPSHLRGEKTILAA
ncbi:MAG: RES family NAD+ phosphorylase [Pseudotabrizicola sp.]|uniref:RES family NAD+ phosphorylase n=1 Tax=Pseudotabrizicola sp. TaxID=2939647 RepID=UPI00271D0AB8|nr:RES family NAD+ phosphorylase [Pseudotabrizicola sp.]MDO9641226.1 RES family NAD+ phosphorylase [Pseudotabrizicola sp.]